MSDKIESVISDVRHSARVDDYEPQQIAFLNSVADRLAAIAAAPQPPINPPKIDSRLIDRAGDADGWGPSYQQPWQAAEDAQGGAERDYPEGFDASWGLPSWAMRRANQVAASLTGRREWDVPCIAEALALARHPSPDAQGDA